MRKIAVLIVLIITCYMGMFAQETTGHRPSHFAQMASNLEPNKGLILGQVINEKQQPVPYSTVTLKRMSDSSIVNGILTDSTGRFVLMNVPYGTYFLEVKFVGFKKKIIRGISVSAKNRFVRIGRVTMKTDVQNIEQVVVAATAKDVEYRVDKKVIHVKQNLSSVGGTAVDILENIPSVEVDIQGNVTLRGSSNFTVFINGKPSVLEGSEALQQIPASEIDRIEIITNPSAKYDPDGVAGIINIITKQNHQKGYNGMLTLSYDNYNAYGVNAILNLRRPKVNYFVSFDYSERVRPAIINSQRKITGDSTTSEYTQTGQTQFGFGGWRAKSGLSYYFNDRNTLTVSGQIGNRGFNMASNTQISEFLYANDALVYQNYYVQNGYSTRQGLLYEGNIDYQHKFNDKGHKIRAYIDVRNYLPNKVNGTEVDTTDQDWQILSDQVFYQESREQSSGLRLRAQVDYERPLSNGRKFEAGYVGRYYNMSSSYSLFNKYGSSDWQELPGFSNNFSMIRNIQGAYVTYTGKIAKLFDFQLGLRTEYTYRLVKQLTTSEDFHLNRVDFFPSAHLSHRFGQSLQMQLSYSRRVRRPRGWFLNPFPTYVDQYTVQQGNPELLPAFSDSYEFNVVKYFKRSYLSVESFWRQTKNNFERIQLVGENNTIINTWTNAGKDLSGGVEFSANLMLMGMLMLNASSSVYYYRIIGQIENQQVDNSTVTWNSRLMAMLMLPTRTRLQVIGFYRAPSVTLQGTREAFIMTSFSVRQDFFKRKASLTVSVRDPFKLMRFSTVVNTPSLYSVNEFIMLSPNISATLEVRLNDYKKQRGQSQGDEDISDFEGEGLY